MSGAVTDNRDLRRLYSKLELRKRRKRRTMTIQSSSGDLSKASNGEKPSN